MEISNAQLLFEAVKNDDINSFLSLVSSNADLKIRFGRFPLLSVCYLYNSYKILNKFERAMLPVSSFTEFYEPREIYNKFKKYAKKSLKYYVYDNKIIYPAEMLAILNKRELLAQNYNAIYKNEDIILNIKHIFDISHNITAVISASQIIIKRENLNLKHKIIAAVLAMIFVFMSLFSVGSILIIKLTSGLGTKNNPILISTESELLAALDGGKHFFKLVNNIVISSNFEASDFFGEIDGNGHEVSLMSNCDSGFIKNLSGTVKNLKLNFGENSLSVKKSIGLFANSVSGKIEACEIFGDITVDFVLDNAEETDNTYFSIYAFNVSGNILNCKSNVSVVAKNNSGKNAFVSLVGENYGLVENCENLGAKFEADTVDIAGIVITNYGSVVGCKNRTEIYQVSSKEWHPNCSGITITNEGLVSNCDNYCDITAISSLKELSSSNGGNIFTYASGIVVDSIGTISDCKNIGNIFAEAEIAIVYAAGIVCRNLISENKVGKVNSCEARCAVKSLSKKEAYVSGVAAVNTGMLDNSGYFGQLSSSDNHYSFGAGVCSYNRYGVIQNCYSGATFSSNENATNTYYASFAIFNWEFMSGNLNNYFAKNKYLKIEKYPICYNFFGSYYNEIRNDSDCGCTGYNSIDALESEVNHV